MGVSRNLENPLETLWQPGGLVWTLLVVLGLALVLALVSGPVIAAPESLLERFGLIAFLNAWILLLALGGLYALRGWIARRDPVRVAWIGLGMLLASTWIVCVAVYVLAEQLLGNSTLRELLLRASLISATVGLLSLGAFQTIWRNIQLRGLARRSELAALQARVNPHFLFNTLNTAISLLRQRPDLAETLLHDLSDLFRAALSASREIPLAQELWLCERYLEIEKLRLGERLQVRWQAPEAIPDIQVPALLVQPLVENAVRHGIEPRPQGGELEVDIEVDAETVRIRVRNPIAPVGPRVDGHLIGQTAVRSRIDAATQGRGRFETRIEEGHYIATLVLPLGPA